MKKLVLLFLLSSCEAPPCQDYVRVISAIQIFRAPELSCRPGMTMKIDRQVQGAIVSCICPK